MAANPKLRDELDLLKNDASKVLTDITRLTKNVPEDSHSKADEVRKDAMKALQDEMGQLKERLGDLSKNFKNHVEKADKHVHDNPYLYIASAIGLGAILGKVLMPKRGQ